MDIDDLNQLLDKLTNATVQKKKTVARQLLGPLSERQYRAIEHLMVDQQLPRLKSVAQQDWFIDVVKHPGVDAIVQKLNFSTETDLLQWLEQHGDALSPQESCRGLSRLLTQQPFWMEAAHTLGKRLAIEDRLLIVEDDEAYPQNDRADLFFEQLIEEMPEADQVKGRAALLDMAVYAGRLALVKRLVVHLQSRPSDQDSLERIFQKSINEANVQEHDDLTQWLMSKSPDATKKLIARGIQYKDQQLIDRLVQQAPDEVFIFALEHMRRLKQPLSEFPLTEARVQAEQRIQRTPQLDPLKTRRRRART